MRHRLLALALATALALLAGPANAESDHGSSKSQLLRDLWFTAIGIVFNAASTLPETPGPEGGSEAGSQTDPNGLASPVPEAPTRLAP